MSTKNKWKNPLGITQSTLAPLHTVALLMRRDNPKHYLRFAPYFTPLRSMQNAMESYGDDSGVSVCLYALSNWSTARGPSELCEAWGAGVTIRKLVAEQLRAHVFVAEGGVLPKGEV